MKPFIVILFIFLSTVLSISLFNNKIEKEQDDIDIINKGITPILPLIHNTVTVYFLGEESKKELFQITRYVLVPVNLSRYQNNTDCDTLLSIQYANLQNTIIDSITKKRNLLYSGSDGKYIYKLTLR